MPTISTSSLFTITYYFERREAGRLVNTETAYFAMQSTKQCYKDINVDMVEIRAGAYVPTLRDSSIRIPATSAGGFYELQSNSGKVIRMTDFAPELPLVATR